MSLPAADDLFRATAQTEQSEESTANPVVAAVPDRSGALGRNGAEGAGENDSDGSPRAASAGKRPRASSGRVRHDEKMTVYVTADELVDIEHARLSLRRDQGIAVDRGRLVREALAIVLADLEHNGDDSDLVKRLLR